METHLKNSNRRFQSNIELWSKTDPKHAITLQFLDTSGYTFVRTDQNEWNLFHDGIFYHDQKGALDEAAARFESLNLENLPLLYVYGVGLGYFYQAAKAWLRKSKKHQLVFLEDDLQVIAMLFQTPLGKELLKDKQVQLYYFHSVTGSLLTFEMLFWKFLNVSFNVVASPLYEKIRQERFEELKHKLVYDAAVKSAILDEYLKFGVAFFRNFYSNMLSLPGSYQASGLFGKFKDIPAVICGAGPSIAKQYELLKTLDTKAIIFAGGSAINALNSADIMPHFGAGVDPNPPQYERYLANKAYELPFFYRSRLYHPALELLHGPRLYLNGCGGYDIPRFFEERLGIEGEELPEGHNIVNFLVGLAHALGCNPIILVGVDLAFTENQLYPPGVVRDGGADIESMKKVEKYDEIPLLKEDINGKPVYTLWKWIAESKYIADYAASNPQLKIINATEGGLGFEDVPNLRFEDVISTYCQRSWDLRSIIHCKIQSCALPQVDEKQVQDLMHQLTDSLSKCQKHLQFLRKEGKALQNKLRSQDVQEVGLESGEAILHQIDLAEEIAFQYLLNSFNEAYNWILQSDFDKVNRIRSPLKKEIKKIEVQDKKYRFLQNVAKANQLIIKWALKEHQAKTEIQGATPAELNELEGGLKDELVFEDRSGKVLARSRFIQQKREGETRLWYGSGALYAIERYKNGLRDGKQEYYYPDGKLKSTFSYAQGKQIGEVVLYYPDGTIKRAIPASDV